MDKNQNIIITTALPYANGPLHLGHFLEYIQADIWARFQRMQGNNVYFICADDAHGTPIMLKAKAENISPEELVTKISTLHQQDMGDFNISFDNFHSTHSEENKALSENIFLKNKSKGHIETAEIMQAFDEQEQMFLPDRFVKGGCPKCKTEDQYGDSCENCGATYNPTDLINPVSVLSGVAPIQKSSKHFFFKLKNFEQELQSFLSRVDLQNEAKNKLKEWFESGLKNWDISRDAPYFGFNIPVDESTYEKDKYFYVWLDAPVGYIASFKNFADKHGLDFAKFWQSDSDVKLYHFIGKDILYFHALFWPAMLHGAELKKPDGIFAHGFLTVNGQKMSKSRGTFIMAKTYLNHLPADYLRYYFAAKLNANVEDLDLNLDDFMARVNSDLVGKVVNIASRCAGFLDKQFDNTLYSELHDQALYQKFIDKGDDIASFYQAKRYSKAISLIAELADDANTYINDLAPWIIAKDLKSLTKEDQDFVEKERLLHQICSQGINLFRVIIHYLAPVVPDVAHKSALFLNLSMQTSQNNITTSTKGSRWDDILTPLLNHQINTYQHLAQRVDIKHIENMLDASKSPSEVKSDNNKDDDAENSKKSKQVAQKPEQKDISNNHTSQDNPNNEGLVDIKLLSKIDLRIAKIILAENVEGADKLLRLELDINETKTRQVFAGIKAHYNADELIGKHTLMVANLAPRKMRFGLSEGMILAASDENGNHDGIFLLSPDQGAVAGMKVK